MQLCTELFSDFKVEDKISIGNLELFPINASLLRQPENTKSLPELMADGTVIITEMSESGDVELAHVRNLSDFYLFIADGESLVGAKQNRIAQKSAIIPPHSSIELPVNCVERSRWSSGMQGSFGKSDFALPPSARERKSSLLKNRMSSRIQASVWSSVDEIAAKHDTFSSTGDLDEILHSSPQIAKSLDADETETLDCNGFVVFGAGRPFVELFFDQTVCKLHQAASKRAWLADVNNTTDGSKTKQDATTILEKLALSKWSTEEPVGCETAFSSEERNNGRLIMKDDAFVHGYFYS